MNNKYDRRELEYLDFRLKKWLQDNPDKDINEEIYMEKMAEKDLLAIDNDSIYLDAIDEEIPYIEVNLMSDLMKRIKDSKGSKYASYRACEYYLKHTAWFQKLE